MKNEREFCVTMIDNASLPERLATELGFLSNQLWLAWPDVKRDPIGFSRQTMLAGSLRLRRMATEGSPAALTAAILVVLSAGLMLVLVNNRPKQDAPLQRASAEIVQLIELPSNTDVNKKDHGVGAGQKGRVGFRIGSGEGSAPEPQKARGGGGSGDHSLAPAQVGKLPPPSEIPAPIPQFPPVQTQTLAVAGIDIDPALWRHLPATVHGDPRSKSSTPANGPGDGGGMGSGNGQGVGEGNRGGVGPGDDGNIGGGRKQIGGDREGGGQGNNPDDPDRVYPAQQVTERARVLAKPEPQYTEEARKGGITGTVVLRVVFSRTGEITNIRALQALPFGLTERAIAAARMIRFRPATRDGRAVNVYVQLEYNFNLY